MMHSEWSCRKKLKENVSTLRKAVTWWHNLKILHLRQKHRVGVIEDSKSYCIRCKKHNYSLDTCFYEHGFPSRHGFHGIDFNKKKDITTKYNGKKTSMASLTKDTKRNTKTTMQTDNQKMIAKIQVTIRPLKIISLPEKSSSPYWKDSPKGIKHKFTWHLETHLVHSILKITHAFIIHTTHTLYHALNQKMINGLLTQGQHITCVPLTPFYIMLKHYYTQ